MQPDSSRSQSENDSPSPDDKARDVGDQLLARVKETARRIMKRIRTATGDTELELPALPTDPTDEAPPLSDS